MSRSEATIKVRPVMGAHYQSDVLGATVAGLSWLVLCLTAVDILRRYRAHLGGSI